MEEQRSKDDVSDPMTVPRLFRPRSAPRRETRTGNTGSDDREPRTTEVPGWLPYLAIALVGSWLLQAIVAPLLPRAQEIAYGEFKVKLAERQIVDVTLGAPIEGVMNDPAEQTPEQATIRFVTVPPPDGDSGLLKELGAAGVTYRAKTPPSPPTSLDVTPTCSGFTSVALLLPMPKSPPNMPPPRRAARLRPTYDQSAIRNRSGSTQLTMKVVIGLPRASIGAP
jgi:hypothetical protein